MSSLNSQSTYNWKTKEWTIPINFAYSKVSKSEKQMVSYQIRRRVVRPIPERWPEWQLRYMIVLLFPKS